MDEQVVALYAVTEGHMDDVAVTEVAKFEAELLEFVRTRYAGLLAQIADTGEMDQDAIVAAIGEFKATRGETEN